MKDNDIGERFLGETPGALKIENLDLINGYEPTKKISRIRRWFLSRKLRPVILFGALDSSNNTWRYDTIDDMTTVLRAMADSEYYSKNNMTDISLMANVTQSEDSDAGEGHTYTVGAGKNWIVLGLTCQNDTRAGRGSGVISASSQDFYTSEALIIASGTDISTDCLHGIKIPVVLGPGDTISSVDTQYTAGDNVTTNIRYIETTTTL